MKDYILDSELLSEKTTKAYNILSDILPILDDIEKTSQKAFAEINAHDELGYEDYTSIKSNIGHIEEYREKYKVFGAVGNGGYYNLKDMSGVCYNGFIGEYQSEVDDKFYYAQVNTLQKLRDSKLEDIYVENNVGIISHLMGMDSKMATSIYKDKINIFDLLGSSTIDTIDEYGNTSSIYCEVYKNFGLGIISSLSKNGIESLNIIQTVLNSIFGSKYAAYHYRLMEAFKEDGIKSIENEVTDLPSYNAGKVITDTVLLVVGTVGMVVSVGEIIAGLAGGTASALGEALSLGTGTPIFALTAAGSVAIAAIGAAGLGVSTTLATNAGKNLIDDTAALIQGVNKSNPEKVVNALSNYESKKWVFGNEEFMLDKSGMKHILERHHPEYWDGSTKSNQTFLDKNMSIDDITNTVSEVLKQNRGKLIEKGTTGMYQVEGTVNGVDYVVGINKGRVGQFYKK